MRLPWKRNLHAVIQRFDKIEEELQEDLKGDEYKTLVTRLVYTLMKRMDDLGIELIAEEDERMKA
jgi:hypothetical protein